MATANFEETVLHSLTVQAKETIKECDKCHKKTDNIVPYIWMAGKEAKRECTGTSRSGNTLYTSYNISYSNITPIQSGLCSKCFKKSLTISRIVPSIVLLATIIVLISIWQMLNTPNAPDGFPQQGLLLIILIPALIYQGKHLKKSKPEFHPSLFYNFALKKSLNLGLDNLWDQDQYKQLK